MSRERAGESCLTELLVHVDVGDDTARGPRLVSLGPGHLGLLGADLPAEAHDPLRDLRGLRLADAARADELIQTATRFSAVPAFIELIDQEAVRNLRDPLRERIQSVLG